MWLIIVWQLKKVSIQFNTFDFFFDNYPLMVVNNIKYLVGEVICLWNQRRHCVTLALVIQWLDIGLIFIAQASIISACHKKLKYLIVLLVNRSLKIVRCRCVSSIDVFHSIWLYECRFCNCIRVKADIDIEHWLSPI